MRYSSIVQRLEGSGYKAWDVHGKARAMRTRGEEVFFLTIGDPDFATPPAITDAAIASLRSGRTHYTPALGELKLRTAIAQQHTQVSGQPVSSDNVAVVAGAQCGLYATAMCLLQAGDEVIVSEPVYSTYEPVIGASGATLVPVPLRPELDFHFDPADLAAAVTPRTRALMINTPHNPTGSMLGPAEIETLADLSTRHNLWLITDEVYSSFTYTRPHLSPASLPALADRSVVISSLSKSHAMTGWRLGWVIGPEPFIQYMDNLLSAMLFGQPPFIQDAALHALIQEQAAVEQMHTAYRTRRDLVYAAFTGSTSATCRLPEGGIYMLIDVRATGLSDYDFAHALLEAEGVALLPGVAFGASLAGYVRLSLTAPDETLREASRRIRRFADSLVK